MIHPIFSCPKINPDWQCSVCDAPRPSRVSELATQVISNTAKFIRSYPSDFKAITGVLFGTFWIRCNEWDNPFALGASEGVLTAIGIPTAVVLGAAAIGEWKEGAGLMIHAVALTARIVWTPFIFAGILLEPELQDIARLGLGGMVFSV